MSIHRTLAERLPDIPRWVEVRDLLLAGEGEILSLELESDLALVLFDRESPCVFLVGNVSETAFDAALAAVRSAQADVVAPLGDRARLVAALPGWTHARLIVHTLNHPDRLPTDRDGQVVWVDPDELRRHDLPADLLEELEDGGGRGPIAAVRVDGRPVSFSYAGSRTETLWDVSIDTLEPHRRKGYAALCVTHLIRHMHAQGKQPVWQALEDNPASWRLAEKLGFAPIDELVMVEAPQD
jgi:GNAT superfamily N-acetyltransferase